MLPFLLEKTPKRICESFGVHWESGKTPTNFPPAGSQAWESQPQIINTVDYRRTSHMQWLFSVRPELILLVQGTSSIFLIDIYWSPSSQHGQRATDLPILSLCQTLWVSTEFKFGKLLKKTFKWKFIAWGIFFPICHRQLLRVMLQQYACKLFEKII